MSYFIVLHGPLGCGKSTISKALQKELGAEVIHIDQVLSENKLDLHEDGEACIPANNFIKALDLSLPKVSQSLKNNKIVIWDGCFYHQEVMDYLLNNLPYPHYVFTLKAPLETCIQRDQNREKTLGEDAAEAVYNLVSKFDFGHIIDNSQDLETVLKKIRSYLPE